MRGCRIVRWSERIPVMLVSAVVIVVLGGCHPLMSGWLVDRPDLDGVDPAADAGLLASLEVSEGILVPSFASQVWEYEVSVPSTTTSITVTAVASDRAATVSETSGVPQQLDGETTEIVITVELHGLQEAYTLQVSRSAP